MEIARQIGRFKFENNMPVLQPDRYDRLVTRRVEQAEELMVDKEFIRTMLESIHEESVRQQIEIFRQNEQEDNSGD